MDRGTGTRRKVSAAGAAAAAADTPASLSSAQALATLASSQNLPAVLNDPGKGKQKDFFTRWDKLNPY